MAKNNNGYYDNFLASLIIDIKSYAGKDPLLPWIRSVKKMKESLPLQILNQKLPRFLQKCAHSFESDKRYRNDSRYIRIWLQLMDFVEDPKALLRTMEANSIGTKKSLFYQAYALYYEKTKRYEKAERMYHLGVQNLSEPMDELQRSHEQFLIRMERHEKKKKQRQELIKHTKRLLSKESIPLESNLTRASQNASHHISERHHIIEKRKSECILVRDDDTVVGKFADAAIVAKPEAEHAWHHGLVDPTINMKEAMDVINNMFKEPIEIRAVNKRRSQRSQQDSGFEVFVDENPGNDTKARGKAKSTDENDDKGGILYDKAFVFVHPRNDSSGSSDEQDRESPLQARFREDTVVRRFVGSTISNEPQVENLCHHGLVDPTINLKEAMEDINNMFGEPIDFVRPKRSENRGKAALAEKPNLGEKFSILEDDVEHQRKQPSQILASIESDERGDLFEPTVCTKEAFDEINKLFTMPMNF